MAAVAFAQPVEKSRLPAFPPVPNNGLKLRREAGAMCDWSSVFHFDYGDDWFFLVTCTAVKESSAKRPFKKIVTTCGTAPEQYPEFDE